MPRFPTLSNALRTVLCLTATCFASQSLTAEPSATLQIDVGDTHQTIRGFGASGAWYDDDYLRFPEEDRRAFTDFLFDEHSGLGLQIYRTRVYPLAMGDESKTPFDWSNENIVAIAQFCKELDDRYDLTLKASPWTPPPWMKSNKSSKGGRLLPEFYPDYAEYLTTYLAGMRDRFGVEFDVLSVQNEADSIKTWDSCVWTANELTVFTRDHLVPAMKNAGLDHVKIMVNEETAWTDRTINEILEDSILAEEIDIAAAHLYYRSHKPERNQPFEKAQALGLDVWMTEFYYGDYLIRKGRHDDEIALAGKDKNAFTPIDRTLSLASIQHDSLTQANVNAWLFWWALSPSNKKVQALLTSNEAYEKTDGPITAGWYAHKWAYGLGQFSKFVRPGSVRVEANLESKIPDIHASAYQRPDGRLTLVVINSGDQASMLNIERTDQPTTQKWALWRTSEKEDLARLAELEGSRVRLPARSITTLVAR